MGEPLEESEKLFYTSGLHTLLVRQLAVTLGPHGHQLLGGGRVQRDGAVKVLLGGAHFQAHPTIWMISAAWSPKM